MWSWDPLRGSAGAALRDLRLWLAVSVALRDTDSSASGRGRRSRGLRAERERARKSARELFATGLAA